jgi:pimeloyl-ACP methyl ester carboxylesterase
VVRGKLVVLLLAGLLLAACGGGHASPGRPSGGTAAPAEPERPPDSFYQVPDPLPPGRPGALIRSLLIAGSPQLPGSRAWAILYHSRSLDGHDVAVSGTVVAPPGAAPAGGRPVLAWGHGSTGLADRCAPSHHGTIGVFGPAGSSRLGQLLERGLVVAATDYQGLGTLGLARFSIGLAAGRAVLDAARAAGQLAGAGASGRVVLVGHSEGGHAVLWAAELARSYAPELQVTGVAAIAPAADLPELVRLAGAQPATVTSGAMLLVAAWSDAYHLPVSVLLPAGQKAVRQVRSSCLEELAAGPAVAAVRPADLLKVAPWPALLEGNTPGHAATQVPVLLAQGTNDERVAPASNRSMAARLCRAGDRVQLRTYANADHLGIIDAAADDVLGWVGDRLAGRPARSTCQP